MSQPKKSMGVQQVLLHLSDETKSILEYLCQQSGKLYNSGVYFARQTFFKTNKLLTGKFDLAFEPSIAKSMLYTSKSSFLDGDSLPKYGEKPEAWKASGKRIKRGLYQSANGSIVNADLNGSANILRKVASNLSIDLGLLGRRVLTTAARVRLWTLPKFTLSAESQSLQG
ncbi:MAG: hypothetical protein V7K67_31620 [Nostoc sp.]|uniref:hypothetical protein n=1 Tax=Nostoc sp. TaxID=1180 RepID=UPI002FF0E620